MAPYPFCLGFWKWKHRLWSVIVSVCISLACRGLFSQARGFDATNLRQPVFLSSGWLVQAGDDPAYVLPDFDDSHWMPFNAQTSSLRSLFPDRPKIVWYRLHLKVAPSDTDLALFEYNISPAFEVYSNGARLIKAGRIAPYVPYDTRGNILVSIPEDQIATGSVVIALRDYIPSTAWQLPHPGYQNSLLKLGEKSTLYEHMWYWVMGENAVIWLDELIELCLLLGAILLYSTQRDRTEYLWLFLWQIAGVPYFGLSIVELFHPIPIIWVVLANGPEWLYPYLAARTYCDFIGHRIGWKLNLYLCVACIGAGISNIGPTLNLLSTNDIALAMEPMAILWMIVLPLIIWGARKRRGALEAGSLLIPVLITGIFDSTVTGLAALASIPALQSASLKLLIQLQWPKIGPFYINGSAATDILSMLSLAFIILLRSNRVSRRQALLESEMANAHQVQQVILPEAVESIPGFHVESVYQPAEQVGGDFFLVLPVKDESLLLVMGDVAGKGLPAAMLVSLLVGSIRSIAEFCQDPDEMLVRLNQRLIGRTEAGFSTALAALFRSDGSVIIANAGHLPPYLDAREVELPNALPLGIAGGASYEAVQLKLAPGSRLTFYSDGVVEAQNRKGELFGFDRGREISRLPAAAIVEAAKSFGQQDDITVVIVEHLAAKKEDATLPSVPALVPNAI